MTASTAAEHAAAAPPMLLITTITTMIVICPTNEYQPCDDFLRSRSCPSATPAKRLVRASYIEDLGQCLGFRTTTTGTSTKVPTGRAGTGLLFSTLDAERGDSYGRWRLPGRHRLPGFPGKLAYCQAMARRCPAAQGLKSRFANDVEMFGASRHAAPTSLYVQPDSRGSTFHPVGDWLLRERAPLFSQARSTHRRGM